jgi:hypothetical protein
VVDRFTDAMYHGELIVMSAVLHLRSGDAVRGLTLLEAAKRAPMVGPTWYRVRMVFADQARAVIGDADVIAAAVERGRCLGIDSILDRELRSRSVPGSVIAQVDA